MKTRYEEIASKLLSDTLHKKIEWKTEAPGSVPREDVIGLVYSTEVKYQKIVLYEYRYKQYDDVDSWQWQREVAIEFVTDMGNAMELRFPPTTDRWGLLQTVRAQVAGVDDFAKRFLDEEDA